MIGAIKKPAVQLAVNDHLYSLYIATHLFLHNTSQPAVLQGHSDASYRIWHTWFILLHLAHLIQLGKQLPSQSSVLEKNSSSPPGPLSDIPSPDESTWRIHAGKLYAVISNEWQVARRAEPVLPAKTREPDKTLHNIPPVWTNQAITATYFPNTKGTVCGLCH